jgi:sensor domain CHASE-containing protein
VKEFISLGLGFGTLSAAGVYAPSFASDSMALPEEGWVTMGPILILLYAVGVVLFAAALALALVRWVIDRVAAFSARY